MATTRFIDHLLEGDHASRPAAGDVPEGALYSCTDHQLIYQGDTSTWATWATISAGGVATDPIWNAAGDLAVGTGSDTAARLGIGSSGDVLTVSGGTAVWDAPTTGTTVLGWSPFAGPPGYSSLQDYGQTATNLAAVSGSNAGALMQWIHVPTPMKLDRYQVRQASTASLRTAEARLYVDDNTSTTVDFVTGTDTTWSFTPGAAGRQNSNDVSGAPVTLDPGYYILVVRNTSATQTFQVNTGAASGNLVGQNLAAALATASTPALGSTFDVSTLTKQNSPFGLVLQGRVLGETDAW